MAQVAEELGAEYPNLGSLLRQRPAGGPPLLVSAFSYFFRREVETNRELAHGLIFDTLRQLSASQDKAFAAVGKALDSLGEQFDKVFQQLDRVEAVVIETHGAVLDLQVEFTRLGGLHLSNADEVRRLMQEVLNRVSQLGMQKGEVKPQDSCNTRSDDERNAVKQLLARFRQLPADQQLQLPALLNSLGKLQIGSGDYEEARQTFDHEKASDEELRGLLNHKKWNIRKKAIEVIAERDLRDLAEELVEKSGNDDIEDVRLAAFEAVVAWEVVSSDWMVTWISTCDAASGSRLIEILNESDGHDCFLRALLRNTDLQVQQQALEMLLAGDKGVLAEEDWFQVWLPTAASEAAITVIEKLCNPKLLQLLLTQHPDSKVRNKACEAILKLDDIEDQEWFQEWLPSCPEDVATKSIIDGFGKLWSRDSRVLRDPQVLLALFVDHASSTLRDAARSKLFEQDAEYLLAGNRVTPHQLKALLTQIGIKDDEPNWVCAVISSLEDEQKERYSSCLAEAAQDERIDGRVWGKSVAKLIEWSALSSDLLEKALGSGTSDERDAIFGALEGADNDQQRELTPLLKRLAQSNADPLIAVKTLCCLLDTWDNRKDKESISLLKAKADLFLSNDDPEVRHTAIYAMRGFKNLDFAPLLVKHVETESVLGIRWHICEVLKEWKALSPELQTRWELEKKCKEEKSPDGLEKAMKSVLVRDRPICTKILMDRIANPDDVPIYVVQKKALAILDTWDANPNDFLLKLASTNPSSRLYALDLLFDRNALPQELLAPYFMEKLCNFVQGFDILTSRFPEFIKNAVKTDVRITDVSYDFHDLLNSSATLRENLSRQPELRQMIRRALDDAGLEVYGRIRQRWSMREMEMIRVVQENIKTSRLPELMQMIQTGMRDANVNLDHTGEGIDFYETSRLALKSLLENTAPGKQNPAMLAFGVILKAALAQKSDPG